MLSSFSASFEVLRRDVHLYVYILSGLLLRFYRAFGFMLY